jgi:hypothetical protein
LDRLIEAAGGERRVPLGLRLVGHCGGGGAGADWRAVEKWSDRDRRFGIGWRARLCLGPSDEAAVSVTEEYKRGERERWRRFEYDPVLTILEGS